jgi:hypothetical protein
VKRCEGNETRGLVAPGIGGYLVPGRRRRGRNRKGVRWRQLEVSARVAKGGLRCDETLERSERSREDDRGLAYAAPVGQRREYLIGPGLTAKAKEGAKKPIRSLATLIHIL